MKYNKKDKLTTNYKNKNVLMNVEGVDWFLNDENMKHFQSLPLEKQAAVQQMMLLQKLKKHMKSFHRESTNSNML